MNYVPKNSSFVTAKSFNRSSFSLYEFYFPSFILTILYIISVSDISSSISTNSSFVHSKSILLLLYKFFFLGQFILKWSGSPHA